MNRLSYSERSIHPGECVPTLNMYEKHGSGEYVLMHQIPERTAEFDISIFALDQEPIHSSIVLTPEASNPRLGRGKTEVEERESVGSIICCSTTAQLFEASYQPTCSSQDRFAR